MRLLEVARGQLVVVCPYVSKQAGTLPDIADQLQITAAVRLSSFQTFCYLLAIFLPLSRSP